MDIERPARKVIRLLGVKNVAHACDLTTDAVYKWANRGAGLVPAEHQAGVMALARQMGVPLLADDLIGASS
jgi:hypothetical protein